ncbi:MAG: biotin synthase [Pseudomonadota bacterium]
MSDFARRLFDPRATEAWLRRAPVDAAPWLHQEVARRMAERLALVRRTPATVIDWWASLSGSAELLRSRYPQARHVPVEAPARLARLAQAPAPAGPWWSPARWRRPAAAQPVEEGAAVTLGAELLWANMVLHWAADPPAMLQQWHRALAVDGFVMFSCLGPDTVRELRTLYSRAGWGPAGAEFVDMHDIGDMLVHAGFDDPVMDMERLRLSWDDACRCLAELRTLGRNTHPRRAAGLRTARWLRALEAALTPAEGPTVLTFEIVYGHAFKGLPRARAGGETTSVSLQDMRSMMRARNARRS